MTANASKNVPQQNLWIRNSSNEGIVLCIEPWGNEILIPRGRDYLVMLEGPEGECPAVEYDNGRITVHGWPGSVASVLLEGQLVLSCSTRVPQIT